MIRYPVTESTLWGLIAKIAPKWRERAKRATDAHEAACKFSKKAPDWSEIKIVFMTLQHDKCAYCERPLETKKYGKVEWDVEHFRPKNSVLHWQHELRTGDEHPNGYYMLAHVPGNYAAACKPCNTPLKHNYFPIEGTRAQGSRDIRSYDSEQALLPFPLGICGVKPETILGFTGLTVIPRFRSGRKHRMGRVTIDFFKLNERESLLKQRAEVIQNLWLAFVVCDKIGGEEGVSAKRIIDLACKPSAPHTNCARSFSDLYKNDPTHAGALAKAAIEYLGSGSGQ